MQDDEQAKPRILVVDDEVVFANSLRRFLARDYGVVVENDPCVALERLGAGERFAAILCDLRMPNVDGIELHRRVCAISLDQARRILFLTADASEAVVRSYFAEHGNELLEKPCNLDELREAVRRVVRYAITT